MPMKATFEAFRSCLPSRGIHAACGLRIAWVYLGMALGSALTQSSIHSPKPPALSPFVASPIATVDMHLSQVAEPLLAPESGCGAVDWHPSQVSAGADAIPPIPPSRDPLKSHRHANIGPQKTSSLTSCPLANERYLGYLSPEVTS